MGHRRAPVIPAKAGIQCFPAFKPRPLDPRLRGDDGEERHAL